MCEWGGGGGEGEGGSGSPDQTPKIKTIEAILDADLASECWESHFGGTVFQTFSGKGCPRDFPVVDRLRQSVRISKPLLLNPV